MGQLPDHGYGNVRCACLVCYMYVTATIMEINMRFADRVVVFGTHRLDVIMSYVRRMDAGRIEQERHQEQKGGQNTHGVEDRRLSRRGNPESQCDRGALNAIACIQICG